MNLPIDIVPNTSPPRFRWRQIVSTFIGKREVEYNLPLPVNIERAVAELISVAKGLEVECTSLAAHNADLRGKMQSITELLNKTTTEKEKLQAELVELREANKKLVEKVVAISKRTKAS